MRVVVCGDRDWQDEEAIRQRLGELPSGTVIIHGVARGADQLAGRVAQQLGFEVLEFPADWRVFGKAAGPIRNRKMLEEGKPDLVIAFHPDLPVSKGTRNMVEISNKAGVRTEVHNQ